jgi:hypothetical protein
MCVEMLLSQSKPDGLVLNMSRLGGTPHRWERATPVGLPPQAKLGEVSSSYGDGRVMGCQMLYDPSVRCADTSPRNAWGGKDGATGVARSQR